MAEAVEDAPACDELYAEGVVLEEPQWQEPCKDADGEATFVPALSQECGDGGRLLWNDRGWWIEGEAFNPDTRGEPPSSAVTECGG